jgi:hypothetical protein
MRLGAVELADEAARAGRFDQPVDAIVATSLLSASDLRALLPQHLRDAPLVLYMHENQAAYPWSDHPKAGRSRDVHFALTNLTSVLAADLVIWNSRWNLRSFLEAMEAIVGGASAVELGGWRRRVEQRSRVIWPPVEPPPRDLERREGAFHDATRVVWPHRWEHDKGPAELLELADRESARLNLRWTILGQQFPTVPPELLELKRRHAQRIDHFGHEPDRRRYWRHLAAADWVLSTARHEYFGIAVAEALLAGCLPWLPQRLSYPEMLPQEARGLSPARPPQDPGRIRAAICAHLEPAVAPNAVALIDDAIAGAVDGQAAGASDGNRSI